MRFNFQLKTTSLLFALSVATLAFGVDFEEWSTEREQKALAGDKESQHIIGRAYHLGLGVEKSTSKAISFYQKAVAQGYGLSFHNLGNCYFEGQGVDKDVKEAIKLYETAESKGVAMSSHSLGLIYLDGTAVEKSESKAALYFKRAAGDGYADSMWQLVLLYQGGIGVGKDLKIAAQWLHRSAQSGNDNAQYNLAKFLKTGNSNFAIDKDTSSSLEWFKKSANSGNDKAMWELAIAYKTGKNASHWLRSSAEAGNTLAQYNLARFLSSGNDGYAIDKNPIDAISWFEKAAEKGHPESNYNLAIAYKNGNGIKKSKAKAISLFTVAAEDGHKESQFELGLMFMNKETEFHSVKDGEKWLRLAANSDHDVAQFFMGYFIESGQINDNEQPLGWYIKAAESGNAKAMIKLVSSYADGEGVAENKPKAFEWLKKAAEKGDSKSQALLGWFFLKGATRWKAPRDYELAAHWLLEAGKSGDIESTFLLGTLYESGKGVNASKEKAISIYKIAANRGHRKSLFRLNALKSVADEENNELEKELKDKILSIEQSDFLQCGFIGLKKGDTKLALECFMEAAMRGSDEAYIQIAKLRSDETNKHALDLPTAELCYKCAAKLGNQQAIEFTNYIPLRNYLDTISEVYLESWPMIVHHRLLEEIADGRNPKFLKWVEKYKLHATPISSYLRASEKIGINPQQGPVLDTDFDKLYYSVYKDLENTGKIQVVVSRLGDGLIVGLDKNTILTISRIPNSGKYEVAAHFTNVPQSKKLKEYLSTQVIGKPSEGALYSASEFSPIQHYGSKKYIKIKGRKFVEWDKSKIEASILDVVSETKKILKKLRTNNFL